MGSTPVVYPDVFVQERVIKEKVVEENVAEKEGVKKDQPKVDLVVRCPFVPAEISIPGINFCSLFLDGLRDYSAPALVDTATGEKYDRRWLLRQGELMAGNLLQKNICAPRDTVAIYAPNSVNWVVSLTAAFRLDLIVAGINSALNAAELRHHINLCRPRVICTTEKLLPNVRSALKELNLEATVIVDGACDSDCLSMDSMLVESEGLLLLPEIEDLKSRLDDICLMLFSSGTTGLQKAISITHENLIAQCIVATHERTAIVFEKTIAFCPFANVGGLWMVLFATIKGFTTYFMTKFDFQLFLQTLQTVPDVWLIPPVANMLVKSPLVEDYNLKLRSICCGAAPLSIDVEDKLRKRFPGVIFRQLYGMTESGISTGMTEDCRGRHKPGTVGVPWFNTQIKIMDTAKGISLGAGKIGEIYIKSPIVMLRYEGNPEATAQAIDDDGWNHTGDLGYYDDDGYMYIVDRVKELIKYNGNQVPPAELEAVLLSHEDVADAAVIGLPDPSAGELPTGVVVLQPSAQITEQQLISFVNARVAPYKKLRGGMKFVTTIPKTPTGKILRKEIKKNLISGSRL